MVLPSFLTGQLWKIGTIGATIITVILTGLLIAASVENRDIMKQREALTAQINNPTTGYVAKLAQAQTNVATLERQLNQQRVDFQTKADTDAKVLAETSRRLAAAQEQTRVMEGKLDKFLATKPQGVTLEDRIKDIDERAMSELVE